MKIRNKKKGSALVYSLIILFVVLTVALGLASVTVISQKMSLTTGKSTGAFQAADSGVEVVLEKIYRNGYYTVQRLSEVMACEDSTGRAVIKGSITPEKQYSLTFKDSDDQFIASCNDTKTINAVKSVGTYSNTSRAVEVAVAAGTLTWIYVTEADFKSGWKNYESNFEKASYAKDNRTGLVYLRGSIRNGSIPSCAFNLPNGYKPSKNHNFIVASNSPYSLAIVTIKKDDGCVQINKDASANSEYIALDGIVFAAAP